MADRTTTIAGTGPQVYDPDSGILYGLEGGAITRWSVETGAFLSPIVIGGALSGLARSPDSRYLVVGAVEPVMVDGVRVVQLHRIDLHTLDTHTVNVPLSDDYEGGVSDVAMSADGMVLFTTRFYGSGWTPLRSFSIDDPEQTVGRVSGVGWQGVRGGSSLISSPDGTRILILENGVSNAPTRVYDSAEDGVTASTTASIDGYSNDGRGDISNDGLVVVVTFGTVTIHDASLNLLTDFGLRDLSGRYSDGQFSHDGHHLFLFNQETDRIEVYDTASWGRIGEVDPDVDVARIGNGDPTGALQLIDGGRLMLVTTASGVRVVDLPARLTTEIQGTDDNDQALFGTLGNDRMSGSAGDDVLTGGAGHDLIDGGAGWDVVQVSGGRSDYGLYEIDGGFLLKGPDGRDTLTGVEAILFEDGTTIELLRVSSKDLLESLPPAREFETGGAEMTRVGQGPPLWPRVDGLGSIQPDAPLVFDPAETQFPDGSAAVLHLAPETWSALMAEIPWMRGGHGLPLDGANASLDLPEANWMF